MFGISEKEMTELGMTWGIGAFMLYMLFIIGNLAKNSNAGRLGTFVLFFVLSFGMLGFVAKGIITWLLKM